MIDIFILGTSGMTPLPHRHLCSCLVRQNSNYCLIDAGEGTQVALKKASLSLKKINYLLLTHYHTDHIGGLPGLLASMANSEKTDTLTIVGPKGLNNVVDAAKRMVSRLPFRIKTIEITEGNQSLKLDSFMIKPFMVDHKTPCFGYQFQLSRAGRFSEELAKQNNVPEEIWSEIQQKNIVPYNGRIYTQDLIMDIPRKGLKFVYVTDTRLCESMRIGEKWVSPPYNVDGWRLDVAADLGYTEEFNHRFWRDFRTRVKEANPDALILAEHYGDPKAWLLGDQWDTVMNYDAFMEPITWFLTGVEKHSDEFRGDLLGNPDAFTGALRHHMSRFNQNSLEIAMNELSNHDHSRFLTRTNRRVGRIHTMGPEAAGENINKGVFREAVVFQMTWPGAPTIYYGDEAGLCGWTDPDNRRGYPWGREDQELIQFHRDIIKVHKDSAALMKGSVMFLHGEYKVVSYGRFLPGEAVVVILNNDYEPHELNLHVRRLGVQDGAVMKACITTTESGYQMDETEYVVANNKLKITVGPISAVVLKYTEPSV